MKLVDGPGQFSVPSLKVGSTVIAEEIGLLVLLVAVNVAIAPVPVVANPIDELVLVQLYVVVPPVLTVEKPGIETVS